MPQFPAVSLSHMDVGSSRFTHSCAAELLRYGRARGRYQEEERWSLTECGMGAADWEKLRAWARTCEPGTFSGAPGIEAGIMMLTVAAAVARMLDEDGLWSSVAESCSPYLRRCWFGKTDYLLGECREALADACHELGVRQQLGMRGKHHYWRTVMLQFGFSAKSAARQLPVWLSGYNVPEIVRTLLGDDENASTSFQGMWGLLTRWADNPSDQSVEAQVVQNCWYPIHGHALLKEGLMRERLRARLVEAGRVEDQPANPTMFDKPRLSGGTFSLGLSRHMPVEFSSVRKTVSVSMGELSTFQLERDEGILRPESGAFRFPLASILREPVREVKVFLPGGKNYRERFAFWEEDDDVVLFCGPQGRRRDAPPEKVESAPCSMVVRGDLSVTAGRYVYRPLLNSQCWVLYQFEHGLPLGICVRAGEEVVWSPQTAVEQAGIDALGGELEIGETSLLRLRLRVRPPKGWECVRFRFAGRRFDGANAEMEAPPGLADWKGIPVAHLRRGNEVAIARLNTHVSVPRAAGAAVQDESGGWHALQRLACVQSAAGEWGMQNEALPADASDYEGRPLFFQWNADSQMDVWLTLGNHALFPEPRQVRLQSFYAMGEGFQIRFGLMNEEASARMELAPMYSTGLLAKVEETDGVIRLHLREEMEAIASYRVSVWERGQALPRTLDLAEVVAREGAIELPSSSVNEPLGWAISLGDSWRGARFAKEPGDATWNYIAAGWCEAIEGAREWEGTALALCAWRFPVLMEPFRSTVRRRVQSCPAESLFAWTEDGNVNGCVLAASPSFYAAPLRELMWNASLDRAAIEAFWVRHQRRVQNTGFSMEMYAPAATLLRAHPVLLSKVLSEGLLQRYEAGRKSLPRVQKTLFVKRYDPAEEQRHRTLFLQAAQLMLVTLKGAFGSETLGPADDLTALQGEALCGLRSWSDNKPMDEYFFYLCIRDTAEALYENCDAESRQLRLAVARSPACCAYLAAYLFCKNVFRPLQKDEL